MAEYTYKDIIIDPEDPRLEGAIGKECYFNDSPKMILEHANNNSPNNFFSLKEINKNNEYPFTDGKYEDVWTLIIIKKEPCYEDQVKQWIEENNLKVGDYVKVTRRAENHADGLDDYWYDLMRDSVGKILKVKEISNFIMLDNGINYPYFVLEKIEPPKPKYVPFETLDEFIESYKKAEERITYSNTRDYIASCGMWLRFNNDDVLCAVTEIWTDGVFLGHDHMKIKWKELFNFYTFMDDSPCGKEVKK